MKTRKGFVRLQDKEGNTLSTLEANAAGMLAAGWKRMDAPPEKKPPVAKPADSAPKQ